MSYEQYPSGAVPVVPVVPERPVPESVRRAFYAMLAGAALTVLSVIATLIQLPQAVDRAEHTATTGTAVLDHGAVDAIAYTSAGAGIVGSLIQIGLWVWLAYSCRAGKNWARITSTVFFGIHTLVLILSVVVLATGFAVSSAYSTSVQTPQLVLSTSISVLIWLAGLGVVVLLWRKDSSAYFTAPVGYPYGYPPAGMHYGEPGAPGPYGTAYGNPTPGQYGSPVPGQYGAVVPGSYGAAVPGQYGAAVPGSYGAAAAGQYGTPMPEPGWSSASSVAQPADLPAAAEGSVPSVPSFQAEPPQQSPAPAVVDSPATVDGTVPPSVPTIEAGPKQQNSWSTGEQASPQQ